MNTAIDLISGTATTDPSTKTYILDVTSDTTVSMPTSATDGTNPFFSRQVPGDASLVTLQSSASSIIINTGITITNYNLFPGNNVEFVSYNNTYLAGRAAKNVEAGIIPKFSSSPSITNLNITDAASSYILTMINMNNRSQPNIMKVCLTKVILTDDLVGSIVLATDNTLTNLIMSIPVTMDSSSTTAVFTTDVLLASTTFGTNYTIGWIRTSTNATMSIRVDSIVIT